MITKLNELYYNYLGMSVSSGMLYLNLGWEKGKNLE